MRENGRSRIPLTKRRCEYDITVHESKLQRNCLKATEKLEGVKMTNDIYTTENSWYLFFIYLHNYKHDLN